MAFGSSLRPKSETPDLIVMDCMMPRLDGLAMIPCLRLAGNAVPVILATSIPQERIPGYSLRTYGAYLGKPFRDSE